MYLKPNIQSKVHFILTTPTRRPFVLDAAFEPELLILHAIVLRCSATARCLTRITILEVKLMQRAGRATSQPSTHRDLTVLGSPLSPLSIECERFGGDIFVASLQPTLSTTSFC